jgi:hypothetical protein
MDLTTYLWQNQTSRQKAGLLFEKLNTQIEKQACLRE